MFPSAARSQQTEHVAPIKSGWCFFTFTSQRQHLLRQKKKRRKLISIFSNERKENDRPAGWGIITCDIHLTFGRFTIPSQGHQTSAEKCQAMHEKYW